MNREFDGEQPKMRILLVEDDAMEREKLLACLEQAPDVKVIDWTGSMSEALHLTEVQRPDAIILDIRLDEGDGVSFLYHLKELDMIRRPYILATTWTSDKATIRSILDNGVGFVQVKSQPGYQEKGPEMVLSTLRRMRPYFGFVDKPQGTQVNTSGMTVLDPDSTQRRRIAEKLGRINVKIGTVGHTYLVESILIASKNKSGVVDMENEIYPELMNKYRVTKWSIERIMRDRIEKTWKKTAVEILEQEYTQQVDPEKWKPELKEFISYYASLFR